MDLSDKIVYEKLFTHLGYVFPKTLPALFSCPICKDQQSLLIQRNDGSNHYFCSSCRFFGDTIQLYKAVHKLDTVELAINELIGLNIFNTSVADLKAEIFHYLGEASKNKELLTHGLYEGWSRLNAGGANVYNNMWDLGLFDGVSYGRSLFPHLGIFTVGEMADLLNMDPRDCKQFRKKYDKYLCVLLFNSMNTLTGLCALKKINEAILVKHIHLNETEDAGLGFVLSITPHSNRTFLFTNPIHASFFASKANKAQARINIIYVPPDTNISTIKARLRGNAVILAPNNIEGLKLAHKIHGSKVFVLDENTASDLQMYGPEDFCDYAESAAVNAYKLLVDYVSQATDVEILNLMHEVGITKDEICRIINESKVEDKQRLEGLLLENKDDEQVQVFDKTITINKSGWCHNGVLVTDAPFSINSVSQTDAGEAQASGFIKFKDKTYNFLAPLASVQKKTVDWLQYELIKQNAGIPNINKKYGKLLYDIAIAIAQPIVKAAAQKAGWDTNEPTPTFVMPQFNINNFGFVAHEAGVYPENIGIDVQIPPPLDSQEIDDLLIPNTKNRTFWTVIAVCLFNTINRFYNDPQVSYAIVTENYEKADSFLNALQRQLGSANLNFSKSSAIAMKKLSVISEYSPVYNVIQYSKWRRMPALLAFLRDTKEGVITCVPKLDFINLPSSDSDWVKTDLESFDIDNRYDRYIRIFWIRLAEIIASGKLERQKHLLVRNCVESLAAQAIRSLCEKNNRKDVSADILSADSPIVSLKEKNPLENMISSCLIWAKQGALEMISYDAPGVPKQEDKDKIVYDTVQYYFPRDKIIPFYQREGFLAPSVAEIEAKLKSIASDLEQDRSFKLHGQHWWIIPFAEVAYHI